MAFKPRKYKVKHLLLLFILAGVLGATVGVLATQPNQQEIGGIVPITQGIVGALAFTLAAQRFEIKRFYYLAVVAMGLGLAIAAMGVSVVLGLSYFYLTIGLCMFASGCVALVGFLRTHELVDLNGESR